MPSRLYLLFAIVMVIAFKSAGIAQDDDIKKKQSQLQRLRKDIDQYEAKIREREKKEHATLDLLDAYDRQAVLLRRLIRKLHERETVLEREISETKRSVGDLSGQISFLKKQYAQYVTTAYKFGRTYDLELLLASTSLNQMLVRSEYLKRFSDQRRRDLERISTKRDDLERQSTVLQQQLSEQRALITEKARENDKLARRMKRRKQVLSDIRRDKKNFQKEIDRKTQAAREMEQLIVRLIDADRAKRDRENNAPRDKGTVAAERERPKGGAFEKLRGSLGWPVAQGKIVARFGTQQHPVLKTITNNTGVDIALPAGSTVSSVAEGEVSTIWWLPSFGNLVIVNHAGGYRTVYAHLSEISVNEGDKVGNGEQIGRSGESLSGPMLHFEIWKDREKQDPEKWLRPRGVSHR